jgi:hypothetical protein
VTAAAEAITIHSNAIEASRSDETIRTADHVPPLPHDPA